MVGIGEDTPSALSMIIDAYIKLRKKDPNHEPLKLAKLHDDSFGMNSAN